MSDPTLTQRLTELITTKPIIPADLEHAALLVLDAIANALAGRVSEPGVILSRWAEATAPTDAARRAFLLGTLTHILETDDLHRASVVHPGCVVVPAAWAVAAREGIRGHAMLRAVLWGFEAATRVGMAVGPSHYRLWHNTATCGPYGSAMATAALLRLDASATVNALGNAGAQSAGLWQFLEAGTMTKHLHAGRAAEAGVLAADLARHGFTGPPTMLEGAKGWFAATCPDPDPEAITRDPDSPWQLLLTSVKPWPSCRHTHPAIDAAQELRRHVVVGSIEQVEVETYPAALEVCDRPAPRSDYEAKFSLQHCVAAALSQETVDFATFTEPTRRDLAGLREQVTARVAEPYASAYPKAWGSAVTVTMRGGQRLTVRRTHAKGDPEAPLTPIELITKARMLMTHGGVGKTDRLIDAILALSDDEALPELP
ncbi:MAG: MmgE/PrpD family protein [Candidatus Contendobacter sp.]|nr:MmgE/PrpD family protein [Candidatus Contendobacter sp.]MDS4059028.1 MmgE/PrpD family protein [Candidatus Contendobacter sp.]